MTRMYKWLTRAVLKGSTLTDPGIVMHVDAYTLDEVPERWRKLYGNGHEKYQLVEIKVVRVIPMFPKGIFDL